MEYGAEAAESLDALLERKEETAILLESVLRSVVDQIADQVESTKVEAISKLGDVAAKADERVHPALVCCLRGPAPAVTVAPAPATPSVRSSHAG